MIVGESGTGKPLVAKSIHSNSANATKPFVSLDCKMFGPTLLESELFGHVKGAFSAASTSKRGLLASPQGGSLFLDEIGDMPLQLQGKLVTALKERELRPIGGTKAVPISVRILAATNCDLIEMVRGGQFRMDLYQLLSVVNLRIPPLRGRPDDIAFLAKRFLERIQHRTGIKRTLSQETLRMLETYDWPDNVRELEQSIDQACSESSGPELQAFHLPQNLLNFHRKRESIPTQNRLTSGSANKNAAKESIASIAQMEERAILQAIRHTNGDKLEAARLLGIGKTTLYRKLKDYGPIDSSKTAVFRSSSEFIA
jgi:two-component system response regulator HydG